MSSFSKSRFIAARWVVYTLLVLAYMLVFFHRMAPAVVSADLMRTFGTTGAALGSLAAMYFYIYTAMQIPAGVLADTLGARMTVTAGNLTAGVGSIVFGMAGSFLEASLGRAMVGLGVSVVFVGLFKSNSVWFSDRHYGVISGLTLLLGNLGAISSAGPLAVVLKTHSWRSVFVVLGGVTIALAVFTFMLVRNRPEDMGFPSVREMEGKPSHSPRQQHWADDLKKVVTTRAAWPVLWVDMGMVGSMLAFVGLWAVPYLRDVHGLDRSAAAGYTTISLAGFAVSSMLSGWLSDRIGRRKPVIVIGTLIYLLTCLCFAFLAPATGLPTRLLFVLLGVGSGGFIVTFASAKEVVAPALAGMAVGLVNTGLFFGAATMQPLFGWAMDLTWNGKTANAVRVYAAGDYHSGFLFMCGFATLAVLAAMRVKETNCRNLTVTD